MRKYFTGWNIFKLCIISFFLFIAFLIIEPIVRYNTSERNDVYVEWTVYTASGPRSYHGTYNMVGDAFVGEWRSDRGTNRVMIRRKNVMEYIGDESICIYCGTNDVDINKIKVIK